MPSSKAIFPLRLAPSLRERAQARASELGLSLNALVSIAVAGYLGPPAAAQAPSKADAAGVGPARMRPAPVGRARNSSGAAGKGLAISPHKTVEDKLSARPRRYHPSVGVSDRDVLPTICARPRAG